MANSHTRSITPAVEVTPDYLDHRDEEVMQALVTAGALVALADGRSDDVERDELVAFIDQREFVPAFSPSNIAKAFNDRVRQLDDRYSPNLIIEALRPLAGLSLASIVIRTAQRVAAADRKIHPGELRAIKLDPADHDEPAGQEGAREAYAGVESVCAHTRRAAPLIQMRSATLGHVPQPRAQTRVARGRLSPLGAGRINAAFGEPCG